MEKSNSAYTQKDKFSIIKLSSEWKEKGGNVG